MFKKVALSIAAFFVLAALFVFVRGLADRAVEVPSLISQLTLSSLPRKDASAVDTSHLADGIAPPTNKWFSGIALQQEAKTVFPSPLSFVTTENSFSYSHPEIVTTPDSVIAAPTELVKITIDEATTYRVTRYDELSVDLTYMIGDNKLATVVLVAGSPYIQLTAHRPLALVIDYAGIHAAVLGSTVNLPSASRTYQAQSSGSTDFSIVTPSSVTARLTADELISFYGVTADMPNDSLVTLAKHASNRITGTSVDFEDRGTEFSTGIHVKTANNQPTVLGYLPHHGYKGTVAFYHDTIYGQQQMVTGNSFEYQTRELPVKETLDVSKLTGDQRSMLVTTLRQEINATRYNASDSYFAGKDLYRSAQLLQLAHQLDEAAIAGTIQNKLSRELSGWLSTANERTSKYFYYDTRLQTIVGETASFGSQDSNDHHFHYGYFIYAASILARYDPQFKADYRDSIDLLVADIANYKASETLPLRRVFDPYFGHSWASGSSPFNDGNNQESTSEALNAWIGSALWAEVTGNTALAEQSSWMLSLENSAAQEYWLDIQPADAPFNGVFNHSFVSMNWGGKRDSATFFSAEPNAKLGILLIPMSPTMQNALPGQATADKLLAEAAPNGFNLQFGDYLMMYDSIHDTSSDLAAAQNLPDSAIDSANSRSYLYAWMMTRQ